MGCEGSVNVGVNGAAVQCRFLPIDASMSESELLRNTAAMMPQDPMFIMGSWLA